MESRRSVKEIEAFLLQEIFVSTGTPLSQKKKKKTGASLLNPSLMDKTGTKCEINENTIANKHRQTQQKHKEQNLTDI